MSALLEGVGLTRLYGPRGRQFAAVDQVSCSLRTGRTLGVVGASGSGKSTLGELLGGLQKPSSGTVRFNGTPLDKLDRAGWRTYRRSVQFIFQDPQASMDPSYTVERVLAEPLEATGQRDRGVRRDCSVAMLERVGLSAAVLAKRPGELSGGQCQRVAVARALITNPSVVVCDECTSALDVSVRAQILNLLRDLQRELGCAYLFISHDIAVVGYMANDLLVMERGRAVESGPANEVLMHPQTAYTKTLLTAASELGE